MDRQTIEITLPDSQARVTLYAFFTHGDFRAIQRKLFAEVKVDLSGVSKDVSGEDLVRDNLKNIPGSIALDEEELTTKLLVKAVTDKEGQPVTNLDEFLYNMSIADGNFLQAEVGKISSKSTLSDEAKKK